LLVVIAIIAILAAILFPVFAQARESARKASCLSNFKQTALGILMYVQDYDEKMVMADTDGHTSPYGFPCMGCGRPDYVWPELTQPYVKNWQIYRCPSDPNATDRILSQGPFDEPPNPSNPSNTYYWGERADIGLNYVFLSPWIADPTVSKGWHSQPTGLAQINQPAGTLMCADSIWDRDSTTGMPKGGGNWVIESPCIKDSNGNLLTPTSFVGYSGAWNPNLAGKPPYDWLEFGGIWPRHTKMQNCSFCDGHVKAMTLGALTAGCDVKYNHGGAAYDGDKYLFDLR